MSIPNSSIEIAMFGIRRTLEKLRESNLEREVRLGSNFTINDILITRHPCNACSISFFYNFETLNPFNYCSCHAIGYSYLTQPNNSIV